MSTVARLAGVLAGHRIPKIPRKGGPAIYADADFVIEGTVNPGAMVLIRLLAAEPCDPLVANRSVPQRVYGRLLPPSS